MCGLEKGSGGPCAIAVGTRTTLNSHYLEWLKPCFIYQHPTWVTAQRRAHRKLTEMICLHVVNFRGCTLAACRSKASREKWHDIIFWGFFWSFSDFKQQHLAAIWEWQFAKLPAAALNRRHNWVPHLKYASSPILSLSFLSLQQREVNNSELCLTPA